MTTIKDVWTASANYLSLAAFARGLLIILFVFGCWQTWSYLTDPQNFPIEHVEIKASFQHVDREKIQSIISESMSEGFFTLSVADLHLALQQLPWVKQAEVKRVWPNTLAVRILEYQPIVRWGHAGLVSNEGALFYPPYATLPKELPVLRGPVTLVPQILQGYRQMQQQFDQRGLLIEEVDVSPRLAWRVKLKNGTLLAVGRDQQHEHIRRFLAVWPELKKRFKKKISYIDLRYPNGIAVQ